MIQHAPVTPNYLCARRDHECYTKRLLTQPTQLVISYYFDLPAQRKSGRAVQNWVYTNACSSPASSPAPRLRRVLNPQLLKPVRYPRMFTPLCFSLASRSCCSHPSLLPNIPYGPLSSSHPTPHDDPSPHSNQSVKRADPSARSVLNPEHAPQHTKPLLLRRRRRRPRH